MDEAAFRDWLKDFGALLSARDSEGVASLFARECVFFVDPFQAPLRNREAVGRDFETKLDNRRRVSFTADLICCDEKNAWSHWTCTFTRVGLDDPVRHDGVLKIVLDDDHECVEFRQWWHSLEPGQGDLMRDFDA